MSVKQSILIIGVISLVTIFMRIMPFVLFRSPEQTPGWVKYLGRVLPSAIIGLLVVYCFKDVSFTTNHYGIPEIIASILVIISYKKFHKIFVSLGLGTVTYMLWINLL